MAGLSIPDDFPLAKLVGQEVVQVCIGNHHARLGFSQPVAIAGKPRWEDGAAIDIEAGFVLRNISGCETSATNETIGRLGGSLTVLLGQVVTAIDKLTNNELLLRFPDSIELQLIVDLQGFDSYHLYIDGEAVDVAKP